MDCKICAKWGEILNIIDNFWKKVYSNSAFFLIYNASFITEQQLIEALEMQLGVEFVDLTAVSIPVELASYVPKNIAKKFCVVPVKLVKDTQYLAMSDPLDFVAQKVVKVASRKRVIPMIATRRTTEHAISLLYGSEGTAGAIEEMKREAGSSTPDIVPVQVSQEAMDSGDSAPTIRFVNSLIERAFSERASDIHLEPQDGEMVVRMRIDGLLRRVLTVPSELQSTVISRLKIMGGMNIAEHILNCTSARASAARSRRDASQDRSAGRTLRCIRPN